MTEKEILSGVSRRQVLQAAGAATVAGGAAGQQVTGSVLGDQGGNFVLEQGDECVPIEPLSGGDIVDLYGYDPDASHEDSQQSTLPEQFESSQTSRLFLYEGPNGLSLVTVHGGGDDERGGSATLQLCGLPSNGRFVVLDDDYDGATDEFEVGRREAVLNWTWGVEGRNDGAVFRGLGTEFCVDIKALWNGDAKLSPSGSGEVEQWQFLSGSLDSPEAVDLKPDEPITVRTGSCDTESNCCGISTQTVSDPFTADVSFCCTSVMVDAARYDTVRLNYLDGVDQQFDGPFEGPNGFFAENDQDGNPHDEIVRSVTVRTDEGEVEVRNPNFDCCIEQIEPEDGGGEEDGKSGY